MSDIKDITPEEKQVRKIFALIRKTDKELDIWMFECDHNDALGKQYQKRLQYMIQKINGYLQASIDDIDI